MRIEGLVDQLVEDPTVIVIGDLGDDSGRGRTTVGYWIEVATTGSTSRQSRSGPCHQTFAWAIRLNPTKLLGK